MTEENRAVVFTLLQKIENQPDRLQENTLLLKQTGPPPEMCCRGPEGAGKMLCWPAKCEDVDPNWLNLIFDYYISDIGQKHMKHMGGLVTCTWVGGTYESECE